MARPSPQVLFVSPIHIDAQLEESLNSMVLQINHALSVLNDRGENTLTNPAHQTPPTPTNFSVQGRTPGWWITWSTVDASRADGYLLMVAKDSGMLQTIARVPIPDVYANTYFFSVGNVTVTYYFQFFSTNGTATSWPTAATAGTSTANGVAEGNPSDPPDYPTVPDDPDEDPPVGNDGEQI